MGVVVAIGIVTASILGTAISQLIADDMRAWAGWLVEFLIRHAVRELPSTLRDRMNEEWHAHVEEVPGCIGKIYVACDLQFAARRMCATRSRAPGSFELKWVMRTMIFVSRIIQYSESLLKKHQPPAGLVPQVYVGYAKATKAAAWFVLMPFAKRFFRWYADGQISVKRKEDARPGDPQIQVSIDQEF